MNILLLNAGSSSLKATLMESGDGSVRAHALADWAGSTAHHEYAGSGVSRSPDDGEKATLRQLLARERRRIADGLLNAVEVAAGRKDALLPDGLKADELAVYTLVSRVLLNPDETITKE